jgi:hypothetical protein
MDANTGEVHFQRGGFGLTRRLSTELFERILDDWRMSQIE